MLFDGIVRFLLIWLRVGSLIFYNNMHTVGRMDAAWGLRDSVRSNEVFIYGLTAVEVIIDIRLL